MIDLSEFDEPRTARTCEWGATVAQLDDSQRDKLAAVMHGRPDIPARKVAEVVAQWTGRRFCPSTVRNHRRNDCASCRSDSA